MGIAYLDSQRKKAGMKLNDVIEEYRYVAAGKSVKKGDFLTYVGEDVAPAIEPPFNAIALSSGVGGTDTEHNEQVKIARVYKEVEVEVTKIGNTFPTSWNTVVAGTKYSSNDGYILEASSCRDVTNYPVCNVSDNQEDTFLSLDQNQTEHWIKMSCPKSIKISKLRFKPQLANTNIVESCIIQGSNDNSWVDLYKMNSSTEIPSLDEKIFLECVISNPDFYKNYRIYIKLTTTGSYSFIYEWQTTEYTEKVTEVIQ